MIKKGFEKTPSKHPIGFADNNQETKFVSEGSCFCGNAEYAFGNHVRSRAELG